MQKKTLAIAFFGVLASFAASVFAGDVDSNVRRPTPFSVIYLSEITNKAEKAFIKTMATKAKVAALQREIDADPALGRKLLARGVPIRHIISRKRALNGNYIFYVR
ncbi:hypothetical protein [Rhizobium sp. TRM95796]|uniref:hypothetical protein n=1 Tax=Rhizobium sp. TRM95796 TaxID=2979862 RepID=UPI0021E7B870|nr:hypothetical protein [Rhizobium sp. TRM95796]MCV3765128.1 hypothetical protein [Rhizobium sp. TRM95796]